MNTRDDGSNGNGGKGVPGQQGGGRWYKPWDPAVMRERSDVQVDKILDVVGRENAEVHRGGDGTVDYIRRRGRLLTSVGDIEVVYNHLGRPLPPMAERGNPKVKKLHRFVLDLEPGQSLDELLDDLDANVGEGRVTPDHLLHVCTTWCGATEPYPTNAIEPTDRNTDANASGAGVKVSVVDTGRLQRVVRAHTWLREPEPVDGREEQGSTGHYTGHGTFIAGVVRAYAPSSDVYISDVTTMGGTVWESDMVESLVDALDSQQPQVISFSGGTRTRAGRPLKSFEMFYDEHLKQRGDETVFVCAAGNDGDEGPFWPAAFPWAVGVGALDDDKETLADYSNRGDWVDVYALGTDVVNAYPNGTYTYQEPPDRRRQPATFPNGMAMWSGTSFATPMVAGLIAARLSWNGADARTTWDQIKAVAVGDAGAGLNARLRDAGAASQP